MHPRSDRLTYRRLNSDGLDWFTELIRDAHIRRYLLDGRQMDRGWCEAEIRRSDALFESHGIGLWLVHEGRDSSDVPIGFCGFHVFEELSEHPQLIYAIREEFTGNGYATEMARAMISLVRIQEGSRKVYASVDEPNIASLRVLEKVGFKETEVRSGAFGPLRMLELDV